MIVARGASGASSGEMARAAATLYAPGAVLVYVALLLPHPGAVVPILAMMATVAFSVAGLLALFGHHLRPWTFSALVTLGIILITTCIFSGGVVGPAFACFYIWSGMYAWYYLSGPQAASQTALIVGACLAVGISGKASPLFIMMVVGTLITVCLWLRHTVRGVRALAVTDQLLGVRNRRGWDQALAVALERSRRHGEALCVAMLDLDHFKIFNDEHGHQTGDLLLQTTVRVWGTALRSSDLIARHGGEEFAVLFTGCPLDRAAELVDGLRRVVPRGLTCSAGVAEWDSRETPESLMLRADAALYEAKRQGRDRCVLAPARGIGVNSPSPATLWSSIALEMLRDGHVGAVYQPVVRLKERTVVGYEALARPQGTEAAGSVEGLFVAAQRMGLTREIDYLCRRGALEGARALPQALPLFVNVSVAALLDPEHDPDQMLFVVRLTGRRPHNVILEISERESITDPLRFASAVRAYREHGFRFAIDDVGAGHSTFETLAAVTPEFVKLAGHFVRRAAEPGPRAAMIAACSYAAASGASVIAEGIEDEATVIALRELPIELGQGYHLGRPARLEIADDHAVAALPAALGGWT